MSFSPSFSNPQEAFMASSNWIEWPRKPVGKGIAATARTNVHPPSHKTISRAPKARKKKGG